MINGLISTAVQFEPCVEHEPLLGETLVPARCLSEMAARHTKLHDTSTPHTKYSSFMSVKCNYTFKCSPSTNRKAKVTRFQYGPTLEHGTKVLPRGPGNVMHGSNRAVICTFAAFFQAATPLELPPVATDFPWFWQNLSCTPCPLPEPSLSQNQRWHHCPSDWIFLSIPQQDIKDKSVIDCSMKIYEFGNRSLIYKGSQPPPDPQFFEHCSKSL